LRKAGMMSRRSRQGYDDVSNTVDVIVEMTNAVEVYPKVRILGMRGEVLLCSM
jgi:hypothetical protein